MTTVPQLTVSCDSADLFDDGDDDLLLSVALDPADEGCPAQSDDKALGNITKNNKEVENAVQVPEKFAFPFEPYGIQVGFMKALYQSLEMGKIGIFESPTGTGKSLSLICGALTWLQHYEEKQRQEFDLLFRTEASLGSNHQDSKGMIDVPDLSQTPIAQYSCQQSTSDGTKPAVLLQDLWSVLFCFLFFVIDSVQYFAVSELDWIQQFSEKKAMEEEAEKLRKEQEARLRNEKKMEALKKDFGHRRGKRKREKLDHDFEELMKSAPEGLREEYAASVKADGDQMEITEEGAVDEELIVVDYHSDDGKENRGSESEDEGEEEHVTKIYYCSRTHSQLSQFVKEIMKSPFGENTRVVSLGSRQNMCINDSVKKLKSLSLINDRCLEMQKNKKSGEKNEEGVRVKKRKSMGTCPFYKQDHLQDYRDRILMDVNDIEQMVTMGRQMKACPYYGSRFAVPSAQVVALPYNTILHRSTREACGIKLEGNIVIIDEAHNLLETINNIHSVEVWGSQLTQALSQLSQYFQRYQSRLKAKNLLYIKQLLFVLQGFLRCLGGKAICQVHFGTGIHIDTSHRKPGVAADQQTRTDKDVKLQTINNFLFESNLDNVNLFKVKKYCERSQISKKLNGFVEKYQPLVVTQEPKKEDVSATSGVSRFLKEMIDQKASKGSAIQQEDACVPAVEERKDTYSSMRSPLMHIEGFLEALTNADKDGRVVVSKQNVLSKSSVKFLLLNPAVHFVSVVEQCRAVIVAGGTMQPVSEFKDQLFHAVGVKPDRILEYSCGHVIPGDQILPVALARGPTGVALDFTYQSRNNPELLDDLGRLMVNVCNVVPGGVVVFFPSYEYQRLVHTHWLSTGFLRKINLKKKVYQEPKLAGQVDVVLSQYAGCIQGNASSEVPGAVLFCVVGGKMSEGINFADEMGRCVIMVGLPYPNLYSPELKEKMTYLNTNFPKSKDGRLPGQVHYENLCMKAVNQSIGRAIRHKNDYASILLLDHRYSRGNVVSKLPTWISDHLVKMERFGPAFGALSKFFMGKKTR
ncbi:ATP-dependent DNA helicase DDX11-like [Liolophura sinensis]|uniref:ATP-dependent DNA helicase DDX11-like n=1 Tax=Liolophura sinensis TaxID=3198878 RepID=UPI0031584E17